MLEIVESGGWLMLPIIICSVISAAIILERFWTLSQKRVVPKNLARQVWQWVSNNELNHKHIQSLQRMIAEGNIAPGDHIARRSL